MSKASKAAKILGQLGGSIKSAAKHEASRLNGLKGGRPRKEAKKAVDAPISILGPTLKVINQLAEEGIIESPTIGGSIALMYYSQPAKTDDLDMFCYMAGQGDFVSLAPIYTRLEQLKYEIKDLYINIEGVDVQFLVPGPLEALPREALNTSVEIKVEGVPTRVFQFEYALAVKAQANRTKDWIHIMSAIESAEPDQTKLMQILEKYGLVELWKRRTSDEAL